MRALRPRPIGGLAFLAVVALVACTNATPARILAVDIDGGDRTVVLGDALVLTATVDASGGADDTVDWSSSDTGVATIDDAGNVTILATGTTTITATSTADPTHFDSIALTVDPPGAHAWTRQFGTAGVDIASAIATDASGNVYTAGRTEGALEGANAGDSDAYIRSYGADGDLRWTRQFGTGVSEDVYAIATDDDGAIYAAGYTSGALEGANAGENDGYVRSYDGSGTLRWTRQFGTPASEYVYAIATDADGTTYAAGSTAGALEGANAGNTDAYVRSYDADGDLHWTRQFGTSSADVARAIATDANGDVYVAGSTNGALEGANAGSYDAFVRAYDTNGTLRWTRQFGTSDADHGSAIGTDAHGALYVAGYTTGALGDANAGSADAYVRSYDTNGTLRWTRQFGTSSADVAIAIATDANGTTYTAGYTIGALEGANAGSTDAYVRSYDTDGDLRWTRQFGTSSADVAIAIATDPTGRNHAAGYTNGALGAAHAGSADAYIRTFGR